ncbi:phytanoyl-CoA dioxygenase family protein [Nocardioides baculatus]|uniref:Phytanoyl-CoA dioxygenase family protein n=1 Tax=Nocardioides baculatus TaxID=2801337 RepID=A0ABS1LAH0_9ACTN|nr:phytanoyl-CoA dioxygenase family protein [Nocardioides baculatus]MBL0747952.1 phytanoyl-CoA dioxygenase family protein [Nocardioides baculatus]
MDRHVDLDAARTTWLEDGYVVLPGYLPADELTAAQGELGQLFPSGDDFHDGVDPGRNARFIGDEFDGIDGFPFASLALNRVPVSDALVTLATTLLGTDAVRLYSAEAWAKYQGAADYDQDLHRDYLNHTILVPSSDPAFAQVEMFVFLSDVTPDLGAPRMVRRSPATESLPAKPNFFPRAEVAEDDGGFVAGDGRPDLYEAEVPATGPAGTVVAFRPETVHRGAAITEPRGARFTMHLNYRPAAVEWAHRHAWADRSHQDAWYAFVEQATPRQLELFGFPPPGHAYWTEETLAGVGQRYPGLDLSPWQGLTHDQATASTGSSR